jgi:hypothetical protein
MWRAGDPVLLTTDGHQHLAFVRITDSCVGSRWLKPCPGWRICLSELTLRDPRKLWADSWMLQLGIAMLSGAAGDARCSWLADPDPATEPDLHQLLQLAREELVAARPPAPTPGPAPAAAPTPQRGWTKTERDAMRAASAAPPEHVDFTPGR